MNDIDLSNKTDNEIIKIVKEYQDQGYQVWLQKRCSDKFLMSTDYNIHGVLDVDNSQEFNKQPTMDGVNPVIIINGRINQGDESSDCSIDQQKFEEKQSDYKLHVPEIQTSNKDTMIFNGRKTQTDLLSLMSPKVRFQEQPKLEEHYKQLQEAIRLDENGKIGESIKILKELLTDMEDQLDVVQSNILQIIYVEGILTLGLLCSRIGQYNDSKKQRIRIYQIVRYLEKCLRQFIIKDQLLLAKLYVKLGQISLQIYSFQKSIDYFTQAIMIYEIYELKIEITTAMAYIGLNYGNVGHHEVALNITYEALNILKGEVNQEAICMAQIYHILGEIYFLNENYEEAIQFFDLAYDIKLLHPSEIFSQILTLNQIGNSCYYLGEYTKALEVYEVALSMINEENTLTEAQTLNNVGMTKVALKQNAKKEFDKALQIYLVYHKPNHTSVKRTLRNQQLMK